MWGQRLDRPAARLGVECSIANKVFDTRAGGSHTHNPANIPKT